MSWSVTDETLSFSLPTIPYLTTYPLSLTIPTSYVKTLLRLVVIISTYILFRPQLQKLFKRVLGQEDPDVPTSVEGMRNKMSKLEQEKGQPIGGGRKIAIATGPISAQPGQKAVRRKA